MVVCDDCTRTDCIKEGVEMPTAMFQLRADDELLEEVKEQEWQAGFEAMSDDPDVNDVEYALFAQCEVLLNE